MRRMNSHIRKTRKDEAMGELLVTIDDHRCPRILLDHQNLWQQKHSQVQKDGNKPQEEPGDRVEAWGAALSTKWGGGLTWLVH